MAKNGAGTTPKSSRPLPEQKVRSPPDAPSSCPPGQERAERRPPPDPELVASEEREREDFQAIFGQNLRAARLKSGLKQSDVAARTGLTQQYLSLIEAGQQNITLKTMTLLAQVVDHDLRDMLRKTLDFPSKKR